MRIVFAALLLLFGATGLSAAERKEDDRFQAKASFSLDISGIKVMNLDPVYGAEGKEYVYGSATGGKCNATEHGYFSIERRREDMVFATYNMNPDPALDECPTGVYTILSARYLKERYRAAEAKRLERDFLRPMSDYMKGEER